MDHLEYYSLCTTCSHSPPQNTIEKSFPPHQILSSLSSTSTRAKGDGQPDEAPGVVSPKNFGSLFDPPSNDTGYYGTGDTSTSARDSTRPLTPSVSTPVAVAGLAVASFAARGFTDDSGPPTSEFEDARFSTTSDGVTPRDTSTRATSQQARTSAAQQARTSGTSAAQQTADSSGGRQFGSTVENPEDLDAMVDRIVDDEEDPRGLTDDSGPPSSEFDDVETPPEGGGDFEAAPPQGMEEAAAAEDEEPFPQLGTRIPDKDDYLPRRKWEKQPDSAGPVASSPPPVPPAGRQPGHNVISYRAPESNISNPEVADTRAQAQRP